MSQAIRVLVVDDSALMRKLIPQIIERDTSIHVVGTAMDGAFALKKIEELKPNVITLDLEMPRMDGMETLREIMRQSPHAGDRGQRTHHRRALRHLQGSVSGSIRFCGQAAGRRLGPHGRNRRRTDHQDQGGRRSKMPAAAARTTRDRAQAKQPGQAALRRPGGRDRSLHRRAERAAIRAVAASGDFPGAIVVVQHMPEGFTEMFARRLDEICAIDVKEAHSGDLLLAGRALICPGNRHMQVRAHAARAISWSFPTKIRSTDIGRRWMCCSVPSRRNSARRAIAVLMTGMGEDGADAMGAVKDAGGLTIAQNEDSCVVFGMPRPPSSAAMPLRVSRSTRWQTLQAQYAGVSVRGTRSARRCGKSEVRTG